MRVPLRVELKISHMPYCSTCRKTQSPITHGAGKYSSCITCREKKRRTRIPLAEVDPNAAGPSNPIRPIRRRPLADALDDELAIQSSPKRRRAAPAFSVHRDPTAWPQPIPLSPSPQSRTYTRNAAANPSQTSIDFPTGSALDRMLEGLSQDLLTESQMREIEADLHFGAEEDFVGPVVDGIQAAGPDEDGYIDLEVQMRQNYELDELDLAGQGNEEETTVQGRRTRNRTRRRGRRTADANPLAYRSEVDVDMEPHYLGRMSALCPGCSAVRWLEERVTKSPASAPRFQNCCAEGAVSLDLPPNPPPFLHKLWTEQDAKSRQFRTYVREYNSALAFTSFNYKKDERVDDGFKPFSVHGEVYHLTGPLGPAGVDKPAFAATYFLDPDYATRLSVGNVGSNMRYDVLGELRDFISANNPFCRYYRTASDVLQNSYREVGPASAIITPQFKLVLEAGSDQRRYNLPVVSEVAIVIPDEQGDKCFRDVILCSRGQSGSLQDTYQRISRDHGAYLPLHYVLFYPYGNPGFHWGLKRQEPVRGDIGESHGERSANHDRAEQDRPFNGDFEVDDGLDEELAGGTRKKKHVSLRDWYAYQTFTRRGSDNSVKFNALLRGGRLFQQWLCDAWACVDQSILDWHRRSQEKIRSDLYCGLADALSMDPMVNPGDLGKPTILASSYYGGDRFMAKCYQVSECPLEC